MTMNRDTMAALRFGLGFKAGQNIAVRPEDMLDSLLVAVRGPNPLPDGGAERRRIELDRVQDDIVAALEAKRDGDREARRAGMRKARRQARRMLQNDLHRRFIHQIASPHGFYERLVNFWFDHFSVSARKGLRGLLLAPLHEAEAIRPFVAGRFADLLRAAALHPAMLHFLDQTRSVGPNSRQASTSERGLNENLGRELLELHSLGVDGGYQQADVRAAALVLTGLTVQRGEHVASFRPGRAEPGPITLLGQSFGGPRRSLDDIHDMIDFLAAHPSTARHIARKLAIHFVADTPDPALVKAMERAFIDTDGELTAVYDAMLNHPAAWQGFGAKARQPIDFIVTGLRALDAPAAALGWPLKGADKAMFGAEDEAMAEEEDTAASLDEDDALDGEAMMAPEADLPAPAPKEAKRVPGNPFTVAAASRMGQSVWHPASPDGYPEEFDAWVSASQLAQRISWSRAVAARFGRTVEPRALVELALADAARAETVSVVRQAPSRESAISFILASPEFNRR